MRKLIKLPEYVSEYESQGRNQIVGEENPERNQWPNHIFIDKIISKTQFD